MNAICHRDYEGNGPIQFYQYDDRIEIMNPGGLYGKATPQNFPDVNDYRNAVVAEALKVLGFVNRFSRGVLRVKEELKENGNGEPRFSLDLVTAFLVIEPISSKSALFLQSGGKDEGKDEGKDCGAFAASCQGDCCGDTGQEEGKKGANDRWNRGFHQESG